VLGPSDSPPRGHPPLSEAGVTMLSNAVMPDQLGGLQRYVRELSSALAARGVPVTIVAKRVSDASAARERFADGVQIKRFGVPERRSQLYAAGYPIASVAAAARAVSSAPGLIHVHYPLAGIAAATTPRRYVHTFHAPIHRELMPERRYALPRTLQRPLVASARLAEVLVGRRAARSIVLTEYMRGELRRLAPAAARRASLIPAGLDSAFFTPGPPIDHPAARGAGPLLFTARRLVSRTGVCELIEAMPRILAQAPGLRLAIAGDGQLQDEARQLVARLSLRDSVFVLGRVSDVELRGWYRAASLFVLPSQQLEGFGMSTVEALACGTPALGTPAGGTPEVLGSLDRRLITDGSTAADLASGILDLVRPHGLLESLAQRARSHVVPAMCWSTVADQHLELYERVFAN